jgi:hypothetical protein
MGGRECYCAIRVWRHIRTGHFHKLYIDNYAFLQYTAPRARGDASSSLLQELDAKTLGEFGPLT